jgi:hypothetical protein
MAYWSDAIIAPTCMAPSLMRIAPNQMIDTLVRFIMKNSAGSRNATRRLTAMALLVRSRLAASKRRLSCAPRSNARITRTPVRPSSSTRFSLSILTCICWNSGTALRMITQNTMPTMGITAISTRASCASCDSDRNTPPIAIIGAVITMLRIMITTPCTCVVSLVVRVISDAVLKWSNW